MRKYPHVHCVDTLPLSREGWFKYKDNWTFQFLLFEIWKRMESIYYKNGREMEIKLLAPE